jgi:hypothetical protein
LKLDGLRPDVISGQDLRVVVGRTLGWQHIKSTVFELRRQGESYRFSGHGSGHGVGLCVIGSAKLAERGVGADAILARYYPGLEISRGLTPVLTETRKMGSDPNGTKVVPSETEVAAKHVSPGTEVVVSLPDEDEGERATILLDAMRARDDLARALGVTPPARLTLRFHSTTDEYERATGQAWFTSGTIVNGEVHVLPLATLRDRGVLDRTIRHELVHILTNAALARRPAWVREGAAIYFAGEQPVPGGTVQRPTYKPEPRPSCPGDNELLHPVSVGALTNAYAQARACFARQIAGGKSWRDVR